MNPFERITHTPAVMGGEACIRGMRVPSASFAYLEREDVKHALQFAAYLAGA